MPGVDETVHPLRPMQGPLLPDRLEEAARGNALMASPQKERGFAPIANELLEAMAKYPTMGLSARITLWVARNTYGRREAGQDRNQKTCAFTWTQIADSIETTRQHVSRAGNDLVKKRVLLIDREGKIGLQKDYDNWADRPYNGAHQNRDETRTKTGTVNVPQMVRVLGNTDNRQQTLTAKSASDLLEESFRTFWTAYPKRRGYGAAIAAWTALNPSPELVTEILSAVQEQRTWEDWNQGERWIPKPERWLSEKRWMDKPVAKARVVERKTCRKCSIAPQHSDTWPYCPGCTYCSKCEKAATSRGTFHILKGAIFCAECHAKEKNG